MCHGAPLTPRQKPQRASAAPGWDSGQAIPPFRVAATGPVGGRARRRRCATRRTAVPPRCASSHARAHRPRVTRQGGSDFEAARAQRHAAIPTTRTNRNHFGPRQLPLTGSECIVRQACHFLVRTTNTRNHNRQCLALSRCRHRAWRRSAEVDGAHVARVGPAARRTEEECRRQAHLCLVPGDRGFAREALVCEGERRP